MSEFNYKSIAFTFITDEHRTEFALGFIYKSISFTLETN